MYLMVVILGVEVFDVYIFHIGKIVFLMYGVLHDDLELFRPTVCPDGER